MIEIYVDGACAFNPGPGGWAFVIPELGIEENGKEAEKTTNNRMELKAAIEALNYFKEPESVIIYSDSTYVVNGISKWLSGNTKSITQPFYKTNIDLCLELQKACLKHNNVKFAWVRGHSGIKGNERANTLAEDMAQSLALDYYNQL